MVIMIQRQILEPSYEKQIPENGGTHQCVFFMLN